MSILHILGISGSLRQNSHNTGLLRAAAELLPDGMELECYDISAIPFYNVDIERDNLPTSVADFKQRITAADAVLIATPEYNHSVPGVLKNALDWASRPAGKSPLSNKPLAMMGATGSGFGTVRAQAHLRDIAAGMNMLVLNNTVMVSRAQDKFADGRLTDEASREAIRQLLNALAAWTRKLHT